MNKSIYKPTFTRKLSSIFKFLATGCFTLLLSACYGTVQVMTALVTNKQGQAIPNIQVTFKSNGVEMDSMVTDSTGMATAVNYSYFLEGQILCQDIDGSENGSYQDKEVSADFTEQVHIELQSNE